MPPIPKVVRTVNQVSPGIKFSGFGDQSEGGWVSQELLLFYYFYELVLSTRYFHHHFKVTVPKPLED